jgi:hypothetical protein
MNSSVQEYMENSIEGNKTASDDLNISTETSDSQGVKYKSLDDEISSQDADECAPLLECMTAGKQEKIELDVSEPPVLVANKPFMEQERLHDIFLNTVFKLANDQISEVSISI